MLYTAPSALGAERLRPGYSTEGSSKVHHDPHPSPTIPYAGWSQSLYIDLSSCVILSNYNEVINLVGNTTHNLTLHILGALWGPLIGPNVAGSNPS